MAVSFLNTRWNFFKRLCKAFNLLLRLNRDDITFVSGENLQFLIFLTKAFSITIFAFVPGSAFSVKTILPILCMNTKTKNNKTMVGKKNGLMMKTRGGLSMQLLFKGVNAKFSFTFQGGNICNINYKTKSRFQKLSQPIISLFLINLDLNENWDTCKNNENGKKYIFI